jgi:hypothetical protein
MANQIRLKRASGSDPGASDLVLGEPAVRTDTGEIFLKKDDGSIAKVAGGIDDGDKGDITVSNSGGTFTIDNDAVTYAKIQNVSATNRILGRDSSGAGNIEEITPANLRTMINVENGATADQTASEILTLIKTVDGAGSGLDADTLDGISSASFVRSDADDTLNGQYTISDSANEKLVLAGSSSPYIRFQEGTTNKAYIQWNSDGYINLVNSESSESLRIQSGASGLKFVEGGNVRNVYHTGNLSVGDGGLTQNNFTNTLKSKLDGIESGATADQSASEILTLLKTVDGSGSGLDADLLDGANASVSASNSTIVKRHSSGYIFANFFNTTPNDVSSGVTKVCVETGDDGYIRHGTAASIRTFINVENGATADQTASEILTLIKTVDGSGSGLDADTLDGISSGSFVRSDTSDTMTGSLTIGDGSAQTELLIKKADNNVSDHLQFYNGTTRIGEIGCEDNTWLRINQETAKNIYTPRYIRADGGFFVDSTSKGINGSGNFIGGTIAGASDYSTLLRSDTADTASGDITFSGGAGAVTIGANSDIRFTDGTWTGNISGKIQLHSNILYIGGGSSGIMFREGSTNRWQIEGSGHFTPEQDSTYDIGTSSLRVRKGYYDEVDSSQVLVGNGILETKAAIATSHTIATDYNALAVSPTINSGVTVTVPSGAVWAIV